MMTPEIAAIVCLSIIFLATTLGSAFVFFFKKDFSKRVSAIVMGLASGIMISVSVFGLVLPAMEDASLTYGDLDWLPVLVGFLLGCLTLYALDKIVPHIHLNDEKFEEGLKTKKLDKNTKFFLAVTMHNIPEGIAVGLAASLAMVHHDDPAYVASALSLAVAIAIQNVPEGAAVSIPIFHDGKSKAKSFLYGFLSGVVEPLFGIIAFFLATYLSPKLMPWLFAFAAGAMIYVTVEEMIPDIKLDEESHFGIWSFIIGFISMMMMELLL